MEEYLPKIFIVMLSVLLLFMFPIITSYERQDDISYAYASKAVHMFTDNVRNKGYISPKMYTDFLNILSATGNSYDIKMTRERKTYYPIIEIYDYDKILKKPIYVTEISPATYNIDTTQGTDDIEIRVKNKDGSEITYRKYRYTGTRSDIIVDPYITEDGKANLISEGLASSDEFILCAVINSRVQKELITQDQIMNIMFPSNIQSLTTPQQIKEAVGDERRYVKFAKDDNFSMSVKNTNITISTLLDFMFLPENVKEKISRIYINYGGTIRSENYTKICPVCSTENMLEAANCSKCGYVWNKICDNCGAINSKTATICLECSSNLQ